MNSTLARAGRLAGALLSRARRANHLPLIDLSLVKIIVGERDRRGADE